MFKSVKRFLCFDCKEEAHSIEETEITCDDVLRSVFEGSCSFPLTRHEVQDIQHAVEEMVLFLLKSIYEQTPSSLDFVRSNKKIIKTLTFRKKSHRIHETFRAENLLKVGSYYENTKNCYPDEFDFIYVIADCDVEDYIAMKTITSKISDNFHKRLEDIQKNLIFPSGTCLEFGEYKGIHGPAASLTFNYKCVNDSSKCRSIFVDLTPACKVSTRKGLPIEMSILYPEWKDLIVETGSFLILKYFNGGHPKNETKIKISITESETLYMQKQMSEEHKRVYRLLKFIFHGDLPDEDLKKHIRDRENGPDIVCCRVFNSRIVYDLSSYVIKTIMFHHCHSCKRTVETTDRDCIVSLLKFLTELFIKEQQKFQQEKRTVPVSVAVLTMTGDSIEIADRYGSSKQIVKVLKNFVEAITDTKQNNPEPLRHRITDQIPLAKELRAISQRDTVKHINGKSSINDRNKACLIITIMLLFTIGICMGLYARDLFKMFYHESEYCFLGQRAVDGFIFAGHDNLTSNFSQTPNADISRYTSNYFLCLYQPFSNGKVVAPKQCLYFCEYERNCTGDTCYRLKTDKDEYDQEVFCESYTFPDYEDDVMNSTENITSMEYPRRVVCVWESNPCLNVLKSNSLRWHLQPDIQPTCFDKEGSHYLHRFIQEKNIMHCTSTKLENETPNNGSICCCDSYPCSYAETKQEANKIMQKITILISVGLPLLCCVMDCVCRGISSLIKYYNRKRRLQRGNIL